MQPRLGHVPPRRSSSIRGHLQTGLGGLDHEAEAVATAQDDEVEVRRFHDAASTCGDGMVPKPGRRPLQRPPSRRTSHRGGFSRLSFPSLRDTKAAPRREELVGQPGHVVILNGVPRAGKTSIARAIQDTFDGPWMNLGVDALKEHVAPARFGPGLGLRPFAGRPDYEVVVAPYFLALYESIAAHARHGLGVVTDIGHHDGYTKSLGLLPRCAAALAGISVLFVGVRCPVDVIMARRRAGQAGREGVYAVGVPGDPVPESVRQWDAAVHDGVVYDLEVDTARLSPEACAAAIQERLVGGPSPPRLRASARVVTGMVSPRSISARIARMLRRLLLGLLCLVTAFGCVVPTVFHDT